MDRLSDIGTIKNILARHGFSFSKGLGQNFLINPTVCPRMAESAVLSPDEGVLEIGPGIGVLTRELAARAKKVTSVELDTRLLPVLAETLAGADNVTIINEDILKLDLEKVLKENFADCSSVSVCANLPYYITSPVIMALLESGLPFTRIVVMVQKEAAARLCAKVGSRESGAVTVAVSYYAEARKLFDVSRGSFMPAPNVDSSVMALTLHEQPPFEVGNEKTFFALVKAGFSQRRKTLLNSLCSGGLMSRAQCAEVLEAAGLPQSARIEQLTMEQLVGLSRCADLLLTGK